MRPDAPRDCPACRSSSSRKKYVLRDHIFQTAPGEFCYRQCRNCRTLFLDPLPTEKEIASFYPADYWWSAEPTGRLQRLETLYRNLVIRDHLRYLGSIGPKAGGEKQELLDIGCGSGAFLAAARRRSYQVTGMDFSPHSVASLGRQGIRCFQATTENFDFEGRRFDVITLFHVLEHLRDPAKSLQSILRLARTHTVFVLQVPLLDSFQSRLFGRRWYGLDPPRHLTQFTRKGLLALLESCGFEIQKKWHFSLRDNSPAMVSSLFPSLDPMARMVAARRRGKSGGVFGAAALHLLYFSMVLAATPLALLEAALKKGGTFVLRVGFRAPSKGPDKI